MLLAEALLISPPTHTFKSPGCTLIHFVPFGSKGITEDNNKWTELVQAAAEKEVDVSMRGRKSHGRPDGWRSQTKPNQYTEFR